MTINERKYYPSKILLFGEYTIIDGSNALAIPFTKFKGQWDFNSKKDNSEFKPFSRFLKDIVWKNHNTEFYINKLKKDIKKGIYFRSNIPVGYGAGSSGSISAAIFDDYFKKDGLNIYQIKDVLSLIEGFFHGVSSGVDPVVSYFNKGIKLTGKNEFQLIDKVDVEFEKYSFYLLDTKVKRETKKYVDIYNKEIKTNYFIDKILPDMSSLNDKIISSFLEKDENTTFSLLKHISRLQYDYFKNMIIDPVEKLWERSLQTKDFSMKLCGAGGGGFYLLMIKKGQETGEFFKDYDLIKI